MVVIKKGSIFLFLMIFTLFLVPVSLFAKEVIAYIGEVGGDVTVIKENPGEVPAELGMFLEAGDTVKTADESFTSIIFQDDGSRVKLGENAQLKLNATRKEKKLNKKLFLNTGKLWAKISKKRGTDFQVTTPTSVASVKGTKFVMEELDVGETWIWVLEDFVELSSKAGTVNVREGQYGRASDDEIETGSIEVGDVPIEPGSHEIIIYFNQRGRGSSLQKELRIEFEM